MNEVSLGHYDVESYCLRAQLHLQGLEVYSTVLWHMKKEVELSYLAQEAIAQDRRSPYAWAIMGNCFSLQKVQFCMEQHALCGAALAISGPACDLT